MASEIEKTRRPNPRNLKAADMWRPNTGDNAHYNYSDIDPTILRGAIDSVARAGGAIMFGLTADGGAYSLCILQGQEKLKDYPHTPTELETRLTDLTEWYADFKL